jgi:hypothetical protein
MIATVTNFGRRVWLDRIEVNQYFKPVVTLLHRNGLFATQLERREVFL